MSGSYLSENKTGTTPGIPLNMGDSKVLFGYIVHKGEKIDESVQELIDFWWHDYIKVKTDLFHNAREIFFFRIAHNPPRGLCAFFDLLDFI